MPLARIITISFVLISPSTLIILNELATLCRSTLLRAAEVIEASVVIKASIVARLGDIIPAPLAIAPIVIFFFPTSVVTATSLGTVSVVIIASAALLLASIPLCGRRLSMPVLILSTGNFFPIIPVEATRISPSLIPNFLAVNSATFLASLNPSSPVAEFAFPLLIIIARATPSLRCF